MRYTHGLTRGRAGPAGRAARAPHHARRRTGCAPRRAGGRTGCGTWSRAGPEPGVAAPCAGAAWGASRCGRPDRCGVRARAAPGRVRARTACRMSGVWGVGPGTPAGPLRRPAAARRARGGRAEGDTATPAARGPPGVRETRRGTAGVPQCRPEHPGPRGGARPIRVRRITDTYLTPDAHSVCGGSRAPPGPPGQRATGPVWRTAGSCWREWAPVLRSALATCCSTVRGDR